MSITRIQQSQISGSLSISDSVANSDLAKANRTLADDLNSLRTQVKLIIGDSAWTSQLAGSQDLKDIYGAMHADGTKAWMQGAVDVSGASDLHGVVHAYGAASVDGVLDANSAIYVDGAAGLSGSLAVAGAASMASSLGVAGDFAINTSKFTVASATGNTAVAGTLGVVGAASLSSTLGVAGNFAVATNKFTVDASSGNAAIAGTLGVAGAASMASSLGVAGNFAVATNKFSVASLSGNTSIAGTLGVAGAASFSSTLGVASDFAINTSKFTVAAGSGNTAIAGTLGVAGAASLSSTLGVSGAATMGSSLGVAGNFAVATSKFTVDASSGNAAIAGTLGVTGAASLSSTLGVTGAATLSSTLGVSGAATLSSTLGVSGAATLGDALSVAGAASFTGASVSISNLLDVNGPMSASIIKIDGDTAQRLYIVGDDGAIKDESKLMFDGSDLSITGGLRVSGNAAIDGDLLVKGAFTYIETSNMKVKDAFIYLATGSAGTSDSGIVLSKGAGSSWDLVVGQDGGAGELIFSKVATNAAGDSPADLGGSALVPAWMSQAKIGSAQGSMVGSISKSGSDFLVAADGAAELKLQSAGNAAISFAAASQVPDASFQASTIVGMLNELRIDLDGASAGGNISKVAYRGSAVSAGVLSFSGQALASANHKLVDVFLNGVLMAPGYDLSGISTSSVTFDAALAASLTADDVIVVVARG